MSNTSNVSVKYNVSLHEYHMHRYIQELEVFNVPKIIAYDIERKVLVTENIGNDYVNKNDHIENTNTDDVKTVFDEIRKIIKNLVMYNIEYPDIIETNFIFYNDKLWITNFEKARTITGRLNGFVSKFIDGLNEFKTQVQQPNTKINDGVTLWR